MNTASSVSEVLTNTKQLPYRTYRPIGNKTLNPIGPIGANVYEVVEILLADCQDLIAPQYKAWFAKRFYKINREYVVQAASLARQDGKNPQSFFSHLIKKVS